MGANFQNSYNLQMHSFIIIIYNAGPAEQQWTG